MWGSTRRDLRAEIHKAADARAAVGPLLRAPAWMDGCGVGGGLEIMLRTWRSYVEGMDVRYSSAVGIRKVSSATTYAA